MIEYQYLCEAITAWKEGRRPQPLSAPAASPGWDDGVQQLDPDAVLYDEQPESPDVYAEAAPMAAPSTGTQPISTEALAQGAPELVPAYPEGEPNPPEFSQDQAGYEEVDIDEDVEDDFERDYDLEAIDDMAGFDFSADLSAYFAAELKIELAWEDKATRIATLNGYGVRDEAHFYQVKATLERYVMSDDAERRYGGLDAIMQLQVNARTDHTRAEMEARAQGELAGEFEPVEGISLERWAHAQAGLASGGDLDTIIAELGVDRAHWDRVSAEWNDRMARDTTVTIATAYGQAFSGAGHGQFAGAAAETAAAMGVGGDVGDAPPVPLDRYVQIMVAQSAAADQGQDANAVLAEFGMNAMEWGQIGGWWGQRIARHGMENNSALLTQFNAAQAKWETHYGVGNVDDDVDL